MRIISGFTISLLLSSCIFSPEKTNATKPEPKFLDLTFGNTWKYKLFNSPGDSSIREITLLKLDTINNVPNFIFSIRDSVMDFWTNPDMKNSILKLIDTEKSTRFLSLMPIFNQLFI